MQAVSLLTHWFAIRAGNLFGETYFLPVIACLWDRYVLASNFRLENFFLSNNAFRYRLSLNTRAIRIMHLPALVTFVRMDIDAQRQKLADETEWMSHRHLRGRYDSKRGKCRESCQQKGGPVHAHTPKQSAGDLLCPTSCKVAGKLFVSDSNLTYVVSTGLMGMTKKFGIVKIFTNLCIIYGIVKVSR